MPVRSLRIINEKGLHARASAKFVEKVEAFEARALVSKDGLDVSGDSIMGLLMLGASRGTTIDVTTSGAVPLVGVAMKFAVGAVPPGPLTSITKIAWFIGSVEVRES